MPLLTDSVPALFFFQLAADGCTLVHAQTLRLPDGRLPLDVAAVGGGRLVVATAAAAVEEAETAEPAAAGLVSVVETGDGQQRTVADGRGFAAGPSSADADDTALDKTALRRLLLHSVESLRKDNEE